MRTIQIMLYTITRWTVTIWNFSRPLLTFSNLQKRTHFKRTLQWWLTEEFPVSGGIFENTTKLGCAEGEEAEKSCEKAYTIELYIILGLLLGEIRIYTWTLGVSLRSDLCAGGEASSGRRAPEGECVWMEEWEVLYKGRPTGDQDDQRGSSINYK